MHCQVISSLSSTSTPSLLKADLNLFILQTILVMEMAPTECRTLHMALLNFMRFTEIQILTTANDSSEP